jgi:hypothetical protein
MNNFQFGVFKKHAPQTFSFMSMVNKTHTIILVVYQSTKVDLGYKVDIYSAFTDAKHFSKVATPVYTPINTVRIVLYPCKHMIFSVFSFQIF